MRVCYGYNVEQSLSSSLILLPLCQSLLIVNKVSKLYHLSTEGSFEPFSGFLLFAGSAEVDVNCRGRAQPLH